MEGTLETEQTDRQTGRDGPQRAPSQSTPIDRRGNQRLCQRHRRPSHLTHHAPALRTARRRQHYQPCRPAARLLGNAPPDPDPPSWLPPADSSSPRAVPDILGTSKASSPTSSPAPTTATASASSASTSTPSPTTSTAPSPASTASCSTASAAAATSPASSTKPAACCSAPRPPPPRPPPRPPTSPRMRPS